MENIEVLRKFFKAFMKKDVHTMLECYHEEVVFRDPVFGRLDAYETRNMWLMLLQPKKVNLNISYKDIVVDGMNGTAKWRAEYYFGRERRKVINEISSSFTFKDHKIVEQRDDFNLWIWSQQALGWKGWIFGWSADFQTKLQHRSKRMLEKYLSANDEKMIKN